MYLNTDDFLEAIAEQLNRKVSSKWSRGH
jgi:hypothetical protein